MVNGAVLRESMGSAIINSMSPSVSLYTGHFDRHDGVVQLVQVRKMLWSDVRVKVLTRMW
jgi:hypothetical protein